MGYLNLKKRDIFKMHMSHQYQYVKFDEYYFCLQQNPLVLAWILLFKRDDLITIQPWLKKDYPRWKSQYFRYHWRMFKRNFFTLVFFTLCKLGLRNLETVQLPVYGQFGMAVHKGFKIFNLHSGLVTKIFDPDINQSSMQHEIEQLKKVSHIDFAPSIKKWDIAGRWYQEEYIRSNIASAHRSPDSVTFMNAFYREAIPCMNSLMLFQQPVIKDLQGYVKELMEILEISKLSENSLDAKEAVTFRNFIHAATTRLHTNGNLPVYLVFSHGDFCPANVLHTDSGLKIVDWETAKHRSLLFDFYSYFFYRPVSPKLPVDKMVSEITEALPFYLSQLPLKHPDIKKASAFMDTYRLLYYIERLCTLVERDLTDNRLSMTDYMMRYIKAWTEYEQILNADVVKNNSEKDALLMHDDPVQEMRDAR